MKLILILFSLIAIKTCNTADDTEQNLQNNLEGNYLIETLTESNVDDYKLTIQFNNETKQVSGFSGCNRFFGSYTLEGTVLKIGPLASTKMMCQGSLYTIESKLLDQLSNVDSFSIKDETLSLKVGNKTVIGFFLNRASESSLSLKFIINFLKLF